MPVKLKLTDIRIDGGTQPRTEIDYELVHEYSESIESLPPVIVFTDGATNWLADGFHRFHAHRKLELPTIEAEVKQGSLRDAILYSVGANAQHGKRRTNADKRKAVLTLLNDGEWARWSNREIARRCIVSSQYVDKIKNSLPTVGSEKTYTTKHGTVATMNTANIGKHYQAPDVNEKLVIEDETLPMGNKPEPKPVEENVRVSYAMDYARTAIVQLQCISKKDKLRKDAFLFVKNWIDENISCKRKVVADE